jgi:hypothetical protein
MAKILSVASTENLKTTRHLILQNAGHDVVSFSSMPAIEDLEILGKPDLAVLGHGFRGSDKRKIALALNQLFPGLPILEMCINSPEVPGADFILSNSPEHLVSAVCEILSGRRVRGFM